MDIALLTLAFGAGVAVFFSPCGVALLPSYIAFLLSKREAESESKRATALRAFKIGSVVSLGIITVFIGLGMIVALAGNILAPYALWFGTSIGALLVVLGVFMLFGKHLHIPKLEIKAGTEPSIKTYYIFGLSYALGGIACTLGVFLFVVGTALSAGSFFNAAMNFVSFTAGSVVLMVGVTVATALAKSVVQEWITTYSAYITKISAVIIIIGGLYLIIFNGRAFLV